VLVALAVKVTCPLLGALTDTPLMVGTGGAVGVSPPPPPQAVTINTREAMIGRDFMFVID